MCSTLRVLLHYVQYATPGDGYKRAYSVRIHTVHYYYLCKSIGYSPYQQSKYLSFGNTGYDYITQRNTTYITFNARRITGLT